MSKHGRLFTQAYGRDLYRDQALYLSWSALAWREGPGVSLSVFTDRAAHFASIADQADVHEMPPDQIRRWRGRYDFTHRLKPLLVQEMARRFPSETLLYLDADTFLVRPPEDVLSPIGPGRSVMHAREAHLCASGDYQMRNFRRHLSRLSFRGAPIDLDRWMWNAGVIGLDPAGFGLVDDWIAFIDEVWPRYRRGLVEQYGIAMLVQQAGVVSSCEDAVVHYWYQKDEYTAAVRREVEALRRLPLPEILTHVRSHPVRIPFRERAPLRLPVWKKWRRSLFGEG